MNNISLSLADKLISYMADRTKDKVTIHNILDHVIVDQYNTDYNKCYIMEDKILLSHKIYNELITAVQQRVDRLEIEEQVAEVLNDQSQNNIQ